MLAKIFFSAFVAAVSAHQNLHQFWVNGETPGYEVGIRPSGNGNNPVTDVTSNDIVCNVPSTTTPSSSVAVVPAKEGDTIKVQWDQSTHPGPITHMIFGPVDDITAETGAGKWIKIDELDYVDGKWANEIMSAADMTHEFKLPAGLASGQYLVRSEMLALHGAQTVGGAQFYIGCMQLEITGSGDTCGAATIELPGAYNENDENIYIPNVYNGFDPTGYTAPGGAVAACAGGSGSTAPSNGSSTTTAAATSTPAATSSVASSVANATTSVVEAAPTTDITSPSTTIPSSSVTSVSSTAAPLPTTFATVVTSARTSTSSTSAPSPSGGNTSGAAKKYGQCGGLNWTGATTCEAGSTCTVQNNYYHQCV